MFIPLFILVGAVHAASTNECFQTLGTNPCTLDTKGCLCNEAFTALVPPQALAGLKELCSFPETATCVPEYTYGCDQVTDAQMDALHLGSIFGYLGYLGPLYAAPYESSCFDKTACVLAMSSLMTDAAVVSFPHGLGKYTGIPDVCDYLGIPTAGITRGMFGLSNTPNPGDYMVFSPTGVIVGAMDNTALVLGETYRNLFYEYQFDFPTCGAKITKLAVADFSLILQRPTDSWQVASAFYQAQKTSIAQFDLREVCRVHRDYCKGPLKQFPNMKKCMEYMRALPVRDPGCSVKEMLLGASQVCKAKHATMVPINPELHCAHIGEIGRKDMHHVMKCVQSECTNSPYAVQWETVDAGNFTAVAADWNSRAYLPPKVCET